MPTTPSGVAAPSGPPSPSSFFPGDQGGTPGTSVYGWLLAWVVFLAVVWLVNQSEVGHAAIFYLLVLMVVLLLVTQYRWFASALKPLTTLTSGGGSAS